VDAQRNALIWDAAISRVLTGQELAQDQLQAAIGQLFTKMPKGRS